jgi:hypothetical protein
MDVYCRTVGFRKRRRTAVCRLKTGAIESCRAHIVGASAGISRFVAIVAIAIVIGAG